MQEISPENAARPLLPSEALTRFVPDVKVETGPDADWAPSEDSASELRYGFRVGPYGFLTEAGLTGEVVIEPVVYRVPLAPVWMVGVINQRGNIVPVFDLKLLFAHAGDAVPNESASTFGSPQTIVVLGKGETVAGICIDDLPRAVVADGDPPEGGAFADMPQAVLDYIHPSFSSGGVTWMEFDYAGLFRSLALHAPPTFVSKVGSGAIATKANTVGG